MKRGPWLNPFDEERANVVIFFKRNAVPVVREALFRLNPLESVVKNFETRSFHLRSLKFNDMHFDLHA